MFIHQLQQALKLQFPPLSLPDAGHSLSNAKFEAYAINYISSTSDQKKLSFMAWSQGTLYAAQWAFQY
jgi:hypothetical protein